MNEALIQKKYYIGRSQKGVWSTVYTYKPHNSELRKIRGEIFAVILLRGPDDFSLGTAGGLLLDRFHEAYFDNRSDTTLIALEKASIETSRFLQKILENDKADKDGIDLHLISLVVVDDLVYIASIGDGKVYVYREDELNEISDQLRDPTGEGKIKVASLVSARGDVYLLGSPKLDNEILKQEMFTATEDFTDMPFKNHVYENEQEVALMMVGLNIDRNRKSETKPVQEAEEVEMDEEIEPVEEIEQEVDDDRTLADVIASEKEQKLEEVEPNEDSEEIVELEDAEVELEDELPVVAEPLPQAKEEDVEEVFEEAEELGPEPEPISSRKASPLNKIGNAVKGFGASIASRFKTAPKTRSEIISREQVKDEASLKTYQVILLRIKNGILAFLRGIKELVWDKWLGLGMNTDDMYLRSAARKRRYGFLAVLILVVLALLYYSIQGAVDNQKNKEEEELARSKLSEIVSVIDGIEEQAQYLVAANGADERKVKALASLDQALNDLQSLQSYEVIATDIATQEVRIEEIKNRFNRVIKLAEVKVLTDLGGLYPDASLSDMALGNSKVYFADQKYGTIYSVDYSGNNRAEIAGGFTNPRSISYDADNNTLIVLDDNPDNALSIINLANNSVNRMAASSLSKIAGTTQIETALINGKEPRLYLLNPEKKAISYYVRTGSNYGTLVLRNTNDDLATATDFKIDEGRIYFTMQKYSGLFKDFNKQEDKINITRMSEGDNFLNATALFIDGLYVYVADPSNRRVLVFQKGAPDIALIAQYVYEGQDDTTFKAIKEVVADRNANKLFVLEGDKILVLDMNLLTQFTIN
jgi:DNA-binding beta-propeller fold protein YncE